jgi:hypothetical protein
MNANDPRRTLAEWLRLAYEDVEAGCPPPEAFLEAEGGALDPQVRRRLDEHAGRCPACAAERDLARLFDAGPAAGDVLPEDVAFVVSRLQAASPARTQAGPAAAPARDAQRTLPFPARRRPPAWTNWARLAAAALVILVAGLFLQRFFAAPPLPEPPSSGGVVRGGEVEALAPVGEVAAVPSELRWEPRTGAASYRLRLRAVDDTVLWEGTAAAPPARLPAEVAGRLQRAVVYLWSVEAIGQAGARLGASEPVRFRVKPAPELNKAK